MNTPSIPASLSGIHFLVGAGASHKFSGQAPYDFPLGSSLLDEFTSAINSISSQFTEGQKIWLTEDTNNYKSIDELLKKSRDSGPNEVVELGRAFVDQTISCYEKKIAIYYQDHPKN